MPHACNRRETITSSKFVWIFVTAVLDRQTQS